MNSGTRVLIADSGKASVVMTSEVFKDKVPGAFVYVAGTGKECLKYLSENQVDMCVVDFDLPDTDGISLVLSLRKIFQGPILLTAYPDPIVEKAVADDLFAFNDAGAWLAKPIQFDELAKKIESFLLNNQRIERRFPLKMPTIIVGKGAGRGRRAPKTDGVVTNISCSGLQLDLEGALKLKCGDELSLTLAVPAQQARASKTELAKSANREMKFKSIVAWTAQSGKRMGLKFANLSESQRKGLERLLKVTAGSKIDVGEI